MGEETEKLMSASMDEEVSPSIPEKAAGGEDATPPPVDVEEEQVKNAIETTTVVDEAEPKDRDAPPASEDPPPVPFKEESYFVKDLKESERKALQDLKAKIEEAIKTNSLLAPPKPEAIIREVVNAEVEKKMDNEKLEPVEEASVSTTVDEEATPAVKEAREGPLIEVPESTPAAEVEPVEGAPPAIIEVPTSSPTTEGETVKEVAEETKEVKEVETPPFPSDDKPAQGETLPADAKSVTRDIPVEGEVGDSPSLEDLTLWGVPLLHSKADERTDVVLLKFLRARDFKVNDALSMLKHTMLWRKTFDADGLAVEDITTEFDSVAYMHGFDKEGHPVCYNHFGVFQDKELYQKTFEDDAQFKKFLRWRIQVLEKGIKTLDFSASGVHSMVQITDFKDSPGLFKVRNMTKKALNLLQDNYPELVAKQIFLNVPWYFGALYSLYGKIFTPRSKSKVVVARPGKVTEILYKYISPENVPVHYGGLSRPNDSEFEGVEAPVKEVFVKTGEKLTIEYPVEESGSLMVWDIVVVGWEVVYGEEFVPSGEGSYTVIIQKSKKVAATEEPLRNSFKAMEPGKVVLTIDATASKRKKHVVHRHAVKKEASLMDC